MDSSRWTAAIVALPVIIAVWLAAYRLCPEGPIKEIADLQAKLESLEQQVNLKPEASDDKLSTLETELKGMYEELRTALDTVRNQLVEVCRRIEDLNGGSEILLEKGCGSPLWLTILVSAVLPVCVTVATWHMLSRRKAKPKTTLNDK